MKKSLIGKAKKKHKVLPAYLLTREQVRELKDVELVEYKFRVMMDKEVPNNEHWNQMWTCNAEMARRFKQIVERREAKKHDNH